MKSTSLSIGGEKTSEAAKQLEESGKILIAKSTSELDKHEAEEYINTHNAEAMELYDKLVEEGWRYLSLKSENNTHQLTESAVVEEEEIYKDKDDDMEFMINLQKSFENEDWAKYSELVQEIQADIKQARMACQVITSELTTDSEKSVAIKYIKEHHYNIMETVAKE